MLGKYLTNPNPIYFILLYYGASFPLLSRSKYPSTPAPTVSSIYITITRHTHKNFYRAKVETQLRETHSNKLFIFLFKCINQVF